MTHFMVGLVLGLGPLAPEDRRVLTFEQTDRSLSIRIHGQAFATYVWDDPDIRRPYFAHVQAPNGWPVTRNLPPIEGEDPTDHASLHPGLWLAFGDLGGADFWRNGGVVRHDRFVEQPTRDREGGRFAVRNRYEADGRLICEEICRIGIKMNDRGYRIEWHSEFSGPEPFAFGDQEEMGLGARLATGLTVPRGGAIIDSEGRTNEAGVWGHQADWCDYSGKDAGILLMPDPGNFRRSWFHARDYGLIVANPFGRAAFTEGDPSRVVVEPGQTLTLRFGILVHDGLIDRAAAYRDFIESEDSR